MREQSKKLTLFGAMLCIGALGVAIWILWPATRFEHLFEFVGKNEQGYPEYRHLQTGLLFVRLPGGKFWMGGQKEDPDGRNFDPEAEENEAPVHELTLRPFLIAKYELTQAQWAQVVHAHDQLNDRVKKKTLPASRATDGIGLPKEQRPKGSVMEDLEAYLEEDLPADSDERPAVAMSWDEIQVFEEMTGLALPSEAQWEYACRAGSTGAYCFGNDTDRLAEYAWYGDKVLDLQERGAADIPLVDAHRVGKKRSNGFGIHDMHGNVWEWCEDAYDPAFYSKPEASARDPVCRSDFPARVVRGGGLRHGASFCRSAFRVGEAPDSRGFTLGFRPVYCPLP